MRQLDLQEATAECVAAKAEQLAAQLAGLTEVLACDIAVDRPESAELALRSQAAAATLDVTRVQAQLAVERGQHEATSALLAQAKREQQLALELAEEATALADSERAHAAAVSGEMEGLRDLVAEERTAAAAELGVVRAALDASTTSAAKAEADAAASAAELAAAQSELLQHQARAEVAEQARRHAEEAVARAAATLAQLSDGYHVERGLLEAAHDRFRAESQAALIDAAERCSRLGADLDAVRQERDQVRRDAQREMAEVRDRYRQDVQELREALAATRRKSPRKAAATAGPAAVVRP